MLIVSGDVRCPGYLFFYFLVGMPRVLWTLLFGLCLNRTHCWPVHHLDNDFIGGTLLSYFDLAYQAEAGLHGQTFSEAQPQSLQTEKVFYLWSSDWCGITDKSYSRRDMYTTSFLRLNFGRAHLLLADFSMCHVYEECLSYMKCILPPRLPIISFSNSFQLRVLTKIH